MIEFEVDASRVSNRIKRMIMNSPAAKQNLLQQAGTLTKKELTKQMDAKIKRRSGRSRKGIIQIIDADSVAVGWTDKEIIRYIAALNYGAKNIGGSLMGWIIKAKGRDNGGSDWLIFKKTNKYGPYNLPLIKINGQEFYIAKKVKHPVQKPLKFIEGTIEEIKRLIHSMLRETYVKTLMK